MKDIKCPSCGKTFRIDPSSFEEILLQIKDEEFNKQIKERLILAEEDNKNCLLYTSPSPRDRQKSRMPSSA